jgi:hypothetical protein
VRYDDVDAHRVFSLSLREVNRDRIRIFWSNVMRKPNLAGSSFYNVLRSLKGLISHQDRPCKPRPTVEPMESRVLMSVAPLMYTADSQGRLFTLNAASGQTVTIGKMPVVMYDIAANKAGQLFGVDSRSNLYSINAKTAAVKKIGFVGGFVNALVFSPNGTLYAAGNSRFFKLNIATGRGSYMGSLGANHSAGDLSFDSAGRLFLTTTADKLLRVDPSTAKTTVIGAIGFKQVYGLAFINGTMYGVSNVTEQAFKINLTSGKGTLTAGFGKSVVGAYGASVLK